MKRTHFIPSIRHEIYRRAPYYDYSATLLIRSEMRPYPQSDILPSILQHSSHLSSFSVDR